MEATITEEKLKEEFTLADVDEDNAISTSEFEVVYDQLLQKSVLVDPVKTLFDSEDNNPKDDALTLEEFTSGFNKQKPGVAADSQIAAIFTSVDINKDTKL